MSIKDWKYDLSAYPWWDEKESILIKENSFEDQKNDLLFVFHSLREPRMGMFMGYLAVFRNLTAPRLLFNIDHIVFSAQRPFVSTSGDILILETAHTGMRRVFVIVDLKNEKFAYVQLKKLMINLEFGSMMRVHSRSERKIVWSTPISFGGLF